MLDLLRRIPDRLWRLVITPYRPDSATRAFMERAQQQEDSHATATVAVLTPAESHDVFGVDMARRGIQPVFLRIANRSAESLRVQMVNIDPKYFTPLEAAGVNHFSIARRLSAFGVMGWLFVPLLALVPLAVTSTHGWMRRLKKRWQRLHWLVYLIVPLGVAHYYLLVKADHRPPLVYAAPAAHPPLPARAALPAPAGR
jgi:hypothetical protein